jgi:CDP-paratose 2-epimerase
MRDRLGICQWFHYQDYAGVDRALEYLEELKVRRLRTGISWADFHREGGRAWYDWLFNRLDESGMDLLVSVWHTPPSLSEDGSCAGPPVHLKDYADFLDLVLNRYGRRLGAVELWNEPNNRRKWKFDQLDPDWSRFGRMTTMAGYWVRRRGWTTVLGGMIPVDHHWLELVSGYGVLDHVDAVGIHGFPQMWWENHPDWDWESHWNGWERKVSYIRAHTRGRPVWITETGLATWDLERNRTGREGLQVAMLERAACAPVPRVYWYSLIDLNPQWSAIEGFHVDENEYHMGLVTWEGVKKPAYYWLRELLRQPLPGAGPWSSGGGVQPAHGHLQDPEGRASA